MSVELAHPDAPALDADEAKSLASEIIARSGDSDNFDAGSILKNHPELAQYRSVVVDLAYEEFCRRVDAGESADPQEFARRFPDVAQSLLKVLEVHQYLDHHPDAFAPDTPPEWPEAGDEVAGFTIVREIGRGGFSRVFLARERDLGDREVVVKICFQANEEAARLGRLEHPHIVPVFSVQPHPRPGLTIICMPYLGSATLANVLADIFAADKTCPQGADVLNAIRQADREHGGPSGGQFADPSRIHWTLRRGSYAEAILETGAQLCEALAYAHRQGICHCDVKPSNVLLTAGGRSLLLDFNLSMQQAGSAAIVGGTFPYMAPEQLRFVLADDTHAGAAEIDHRTDLFALGVTMFQLLTGKLPFPTEDLPQDRKEAARLLLERQRQAGELRGELDQVVSPAIARTITDCLAFERAERPDSAEQVAQQFRDDLRAVPRARRWVRAHKLVLASVAAILLMAGTALGIGLAMRAPLYERQYNLGVAYLEAGDFTAASRCFDSALDARSDFAQALLLRGWADLMASQRAGLGEVERSGKLSSARKFLEASWKQTGSADSAASLAWCETQMGNHGEATNYFVRAAELGLATPAVLNNWGYCLAKAKKLVDAAVRLEDAVRLDSTLQAARHNLAVVEWRLAGEEVFRAQRERRDNGGKDIEARHQARAADLLQSARKHIDAARTSGPRSADLELAAASIYASAAAAVVGRTDPDSAAWEQEFLEKAWSFCQAAVELHLPPVRLKELPVLAPRLGQDPRFQRLLKQAPAATQPIPANLLVDVFPDIRDRLMVIQP